MMQKAPLSVVELRSGALYDIMRSFTSFEKVR
jgi:hypothetical protein